MAGIQLSAARRNVKESMSTWRQMAFKPRTFGASGSRPLRPCSPVEKPVTRELFAQRPRQAAVLVPTITETLTSAGLLETLFQVKTRFLIGGQVT